MNPYLKTILRDLGLFLHVPGIMALVSLLVCVAWGEYFAIRAFTITAIATLATGQLFYRTCSQGASASRIRYAMLTVALAWAIVPLFGAIPFILIAQNLTISGDASATVIYFQNSLNAVFEAFSGFTSTGLTMALNPSRLPHSIQWWRSLMEWVGGVGVIVLVVSLLDPSTDAYQLYSAEGRSKRIGLTVQVTVRRIWWIYILYTFVSIIWLRLVGMPWWDAINHGMTGISTGGFSIQDDSIGAYSQTIQMAVVPIMIAGAISFPVHYQLVREFRFFALWKDSQHKAFWILLALGICLLWFFNYSFNWSVVWREAVFQWVSALGTCGFSTVNLKKWTAGAKLLLSIGMIIGGAAGSTVGGIKLSRAVVLFKAILWRFQRLHLKPHQIMRYKLDERVVTETEAIRRVEAAAVLTILWLGLLLIGVFVLLEVVSAYEYNLSDVIFEAASALGSVGLSTGITAPDLAPLGKISLIIFMWMGRLEIIPVVLLFSAPFVALTKVSRSRKIKK
ncbi:TrkH family potassium uptake protein [Oscillatoria salina]|uniref:TrkH family potassium uptake protein n=1 Tax=Oscillatoria salina TaxID=331517 RepID=UPI001CCE0E7B|nr:TrkH family potassium uptake protein [Oscillatoria salina]